MGLCSRPPPGPAVQNRLHQQAGQKTAPDQRQYIKLLLHCGSHPQRHFELSARRPLSAESRRSAALMASTRSQDDAEVFPPRQAFLPDWFSMQSTTLVSAGFPVQILSQAAGLHSGLPIRLLARTAIAALPYSEVLRGEYRVAFGGGFAAANVGRGLDLRWL